MLQSVITLSSSARSRRKFTRLVTRFLVNPNHALKNITLYFDDEILKAVVFFLLALVRRRILKYNKRGYFNISLNQNKQNDVKKSPYISKKRGPSLQYAMCR